MNSRASPPNLVKLLDGVVSAASTTEFFGGVLRDRAASISSVGAFKDLPATPILCYRSQRLARVLSDASRLQWIAGPYLGHSASRVAAAEDVDAGRVRVDAIKDALAGSLPTTSGHSAAVITSPQSRYFSAEMATILVRMGIAAHLFIDPGPSRTRELLHDLQPSVLVAMSEGLEERSIPSCVELCVTARRTHRFKGFQQLDLYVVNELGLLGQSDDCEEYQLNHHSYFFERSDADRLVVTPLHNHIQPMLRLETLDRVEFIDDHRARLTLAPDGG